MHAGSGAGRDPKTRFTDRVANYVKYRPSYPRQLLTFLRDHLQLTRESQVADIGSGTGIFSALLLELDCTVYGVEPNDAMRAVADDCLGGRKTFKSVRAAAENTGIESGSIDLITAAQAFHWFEKDKAKVEFLRILKPGGHVALIWNDRKTHGTPFAVAYEALIVKYGTDYLQVRQASANDQKLIADFFAPQAFAIERFSNAQDFDLEGLKGRLLSSSYMPQEGHPRFASMLADLASLFAAYNEQGSVRIDYDCEVYWGQLHTPPGPA